MQAGVHLQAELDAVKRELARVRQELKDKEAELEVARKDLFTSTGENAVLRKLLQRRQGGSASGISPGAPPGDRAQNGTQRGEAAPPQKDSKASQACLIS